MRIQTGCWWMQVVPHTNYNSLGYLVFMPDIGSGEYAGMKA